MNKLPLLFGVLALCAAGTAQQNVAVPLGMATSNTGTTSLIWRNTAFRFQMLYDETNLLRQGINYPITISRLQFRASGGVTSPGGETYTGVTVQMSTSPSDWANPSTTFATNRGPDNRTVFTGNVVCLPAAGTSPNTYIIDIPLATPFVYDPTAAQDLCIEVDAPAPLPATVPNIAASSNATQLARRVSAASQAATTGSTSYFAAVCLMDFTPVANAASASKYGEGCIGRAQSYYEIFPVGTFDMAGSPAAPNSILMTPVGTGYAVSPGTNGWFTPTAAPLALTDDSLSPPQTLPFTFAFPGGSTNDILVCSNGFVWLDNTMTATNAAGSSGLLLTEGPRLAPLWNDLDPSVGGAVTFDVDPAQTAVYVTWDQVPLFNLPGTSSTIQLVLYNSGAVEYRWQAVNNGNALVGWSPGRGVRDPGSIDISASMPFITQPDTWPLALEPVNRPKFGNNLRMEVENLVVGSTLGAVFFGFRAVTPGLHLSVIGMPTCYQNASIDVTAPFAVTGATQPFAITIPTTPSLAGLHLYAQAIANAPGVNALSLITSNGVDLLFNPN